MKSVTAAQTADVIIFFDGVQTDGTCISGVGKLLSRYRSLNLIFIIISLTLIIRLGFGGSICVGCGRFCSARSIVRGRHFWCMVVLLSYRGGLDNFRATVFQ